jgi:hypothetical protein
MAIIFVDYTQLYYQEVAKTAVPAVLSGKFVRIRSESTDYLVFAPKEFTKYHANIVERFCIDRGIEGSYDSEGKRYELADRAWTLGAVKAFRIFTSISGESSFISCTSCR